MLRGVLAFISSGVLFRPYNLAGVGLGIFLLVVAKDYNALYALFKTAQPYTGVLLIAGVLAFFRASSRPYGRFAPGAFLLNWLGQFLGIMVAMLTLIGFYIMTIG